MWTKLILFHSFFFLQKKMTKRKRSTHLLLFYERVIKRCCDLIWTIVFFFSIMSKASIIWPKIQFDTHMAEKNVFWAVAFSIVIFIIVIITKIQTYSSLILEIRVFCLFAYSIDCLEWHKRFLFSSESFPLQSSVPKKMRILRNAKNCVTIKYGSFLSHTICPKWHQTLVGMQ